MTKIEKKKVHRLVYDRDLVGSHVCSELAKGRSLNNILTMDGNMPTPATFLQWLEDDPEGLGKHYAHAREVGYRLLADEIVAISDETHTTTWIHEQDVDGNYLFNPDKSPKLKEMLVPLSPDVIARNRLRVDTRKWMLSKMLPKIYGDKITNEHTGKDGGPIALAAVDLRGLSDAELTQMQTLLGKATGGVE